MASAGNGEQENQGTTGGPVNPELRQLILDLCAKVEEVVHNNDWPTEEGHMHDDGVTCSCPILDLTTFIKSKL